MKQVIRNMHANRITRSKKMIALDDQKDLFDMIKWHVYCYGYVTIPRSSIGVYLYHRLKQHYLIRTEKYAFTFRESVEE